MQTFYKFPKLNSGVNYRLKDILIFPLAKKNIKTLQIVDITFTGKFAGLEQLERHSYGAAFGHKLLHKKLCYFGCNCEAQKLSRIYNVKKSGFGPAKVSKNAVTIVRIFAKINVIKPAEYKTPELKLFRKKNWC